MKSKLKNWKALREEVSVQKNVIAQLNQLYKSYSNLLNKSRTHGEACCDGGHFGCRILHARFNFIKKLDVGVVNKNKNQDHNF